MARRKVHPWFASAGLLYSPKRIERNIHRYRQQVRAQLALIIRDLENQIDWAAGQYLPLRVPCRSSAMRDYLRPLIQATNQYRFTVRQWSGDRTVAHTPFWGYAETNCGLDELLGGPGVNYWGTACGGEGKSDAFEQFVDLVRSNRELRGRGGLYGMITNGLAPEVVQLFTEDPLAETLLVGTIAEAAEAVVKELVGISAAYRWHELDEDEVERRRVVYHFLSENDNTEAGYGILLTEYDQSLLRLSDAIVGDLRVLVARKLGICPNRDSEPTTQLPEQLAPVIQLRRRSRSPLLVASGQ